MHRDREILEAQSVIQLLIRVRAKLRWDGLWLDLPLGSSAIHCIYSSIYPSVYLCTDLSVIMRMYSAKWNPTVINLR